MARSVKGERAMLPLVTGHARRGSWELLLASKNAVRGSQNDSIAAAVQ